MALVVAAAVAAVAVLQMSTLTNDIQQIVVEHWLAPVSSYTNRYHIAMHHYHLVPSVVDHWSTCHNRLVLPLPLTWDDVEPRVRPQSMRPRLRYSNGVDDDGASD